MLGGLHLMNTPMQADKTASTLILMLGTHADCHTQPNITVHELVGLDAPTLIGVQFASTSSAHAEKHFHIHNDKGIL